VGEGVGGGGGGGGGGEGGGVGGGAGGGGERLGERGAQLGLDHVAEEGVGDSEQGGVVVDAADGGQGEVGPPLGRLDLLQQIGERSVPRRRVVHRLCHRRPSHPCLHRTRAARNPSGRESWSPRRTRTVHRFSTPVYRPHGNGQVHRPSVFVVVLTVANE